eukprot:scaffold4845_cov51-Attheya_sp.AAC.3
MMDATQYSEPLLDSDWDSEAGLSSMMKMHDTSPDHDEYETGSNQGSSNLHEVIFTEVTVHKSPPKKIVHAFKKIMEDGTATITFYAGVLFSNMTLLAGIA